MLHTFSSEIAPASSDAAAASFFRNSVTFHVLGVLVFACIIPHLGLPDMSLIIGRSSISTDETKTPTREELRTWSRYARDVLLPRVRTGGEVILSPKILDEAHEFLSLLNRAYINVETLRYTRVHTALEEIGSLGSRWPMTIILKAEGLLSLWEADFGPLRNIQADLFGPGGRLEGIVKLKHWKTSWDSKVTSRASLEVATVVKSKTWGTGWNVEGGKGPFYSFMPGHNGFKVGDWWIKRAAAYRGGIIHGLPHGITADEEGAYAVLMTDDDELETGKENMIKYRSSQLDPGCFKLMKNIESRQLVRVLRSWRLSSERRPRAGLRYDGLYRVSGYGVKLVTNASEGDQWQYTFTFERHDAQPGFDKALCHPTADEMDDWNDYKRMKHNLGEEVVNVQHHVAKQRTEVRGWMGDQPRDKKESGYFTGESSDEENSA